MDELNIQEEIIRPTYRFAGFWMRFWAYLLDLLVVSSLTSIIVTPILNISGLRGVQLAFFSIEIILIAIVTLLYFVLLTKKWGQTIGKRVFGIKVVSKNSQQLTWSALIFREVVGRYILQAFTLSYTLYVIVAFQRKKQGLHDMIGDTYVVHDEI
ncbi:MAG: RDD family protein [Anaerobacillus sp.]|uniref:RDD family protein n=1 Tax=Anaerobacillus sp. TaxID=1872506 RepID=UPI00391D62D5